MCSFAPCQRIGVPKRPLRCGRCRPASLGSKRVVKAVAREALHNALKHSGARGARLSLEAHEGEILLVVADEGRGFDVGQAAGSGLGLRGMRERAESLGGTLTLTAVEGEGTQLWVRIPRRSESGF